MRKGEDRRRKLPRPIVVRGGKTLRLLSDCRSYTVDLDRDEAARAPWRHAAELMLAAANGGDLEEVASVRTNASSSVRISWCCKMGLPANAPNNRPI
jgi:hypothetical protein